MRRHLPAPLLSCALVLAFLTLPACTNDVAVPGRSQGAACFDDGTCEAPLECVSDRCRALDPCLTGNGGCDALTICYPTDPGPTCGPCPPGYTGDGATGCVDIDECLTGNGGCDALTTCTNIDAGRICGACPAGYTGDGATGCLDIDECDTNNGDCDARTLCTNIDGGRSCGACPAGYTGIGETGCVDIDECETDNGGCDVISNCMNRPGTVECSGCPGGFAGDGAVGCGTWRGIPGGTFDMGTTSQVNTQPVHSVTVPDFQMMKSEVTVEQWVSCIIRGVCPVTADVSPLCNYGSFRALDHPINCVGWRQAATFCAWMNARLPTEAEWEYAARRQGQDIDYPWGNTAPDCSVAMMDEGAPPPGCGTGSTARVCSIPAGNTQRGLCDMAGNLWEWTEDDYHGDYTGAPADGSAWVESPRSTSGVYRGGSFASDSVGLSVHTRNGNDPFAASLESIGFRCVRDWTAPPPP